VRSSTAGSSSGRRQLGVLLPIGVIVIMRSISTCRLLLLLRLLLE